MAIKGKEQQSARKLYTGLCDMKVVAFNPTQQELSEILGIEDVNEPNYLYN